MNSRILLRTIGAAIFDSVLVFVATTWWALEWSGVAIVHTVAGDGSPRRTHGWVAEIDGQTWLEAGTPTNGWYLDVLERPSLELEIDGHTRAWIATPVPEATAHQRLREALRARYGLRDRWVEMFVDTTRSVAVRLGVPDRGAPESDSRE